MLSWVVIDCRYKLEEAKEETGLIHAPMLGSRCLDHVQAPIFDLVDYINSGKNSRIEILKNLVVCIEFNRLH